MSRIRGVLALVALAGGLLWPASSQAYDQPAVNLGFTSFLDGGPPAGPGFYFSEYLQYYGSSRLNDQNGDKIPLPDPKVTAWVSLSQFLYQSNQPVLLGGKWGLDVIVPVVSLSSEYGGGAAGPADNGTGLGDLLVGPFLQWDPIMGANGPRFMHRIELQILLPTGKYDKDKELNPGSGVFSFNPYWAGTYFWTPKCTSSLRLHYLWNAANSDPNRGFGAADDAQAGAAIHANLAAEYEVMPKQLRLGLNGYYLKQISDTKAAGNDVADRQEQVLGIGPGLVYHRSPEQHLFLNLFTEVLAENRTKGTRVILRYVQHL
jgi:anthranilate 1,2-dioxygenase (deaminating, decarboxylating) large subunit